MVTYRLLLACLAGLGAATAAAAGPSQDTPAVTKAAQETKAERTAHTVKPGAPVRVTFGMKGAPRAGQPLPIDIAIVPQAPSARLDVDVRPSGDLALTGERRAPRFVNVKPSTAYRHAVSVIPRTEGRHELAVTVFMDTPNGPLARVFVLPIPVGTAAAASAPAPATEWTGRRIRSLPAERVP